MKKHLILAEPHGEGEPDGYGQWDIFKKLAHLARLRRVWPDAREQCQFAPFPVAVDIGVANLTQPRKLGFEIEQLIRWVFVLAGNSPKEPGMETRRGGSNVLEIAEDATRSEGLEYLLIESTFSLVRQVMNCKTRHHKVKLPHRRQFVFKIVGDNADAGLRSKQITRSLQHRWRKVQPDKLRARKCRFHQRKEPSSATAQVKNASCLSGHKLEKGGLTLDAVRNRVRSPEIVQGMFSGGPKIDDG